MPHTGNNDSDCGPNYGTRASNEEARRAMLQRAAKEWTEALCDVLATGGQVAAAQYDRLARAEAALYALAK